MAIDLTGQIIVSDSNNNRMQVCDELGNCAPFGHTGTNGVEFDQPGGIAIGALDRVIVADSANHRIQVLQRCAPTQRIFIEGFEE